MPKLPDLYLSLDTHLTDRISGKTANYKLFEGSDTFDVPEPPGSLAAPMSGNSMATSFNGLNSFVFFRDAPAFRAATFWVCPESVAEQQFFFCRLLPGKERLTDIAIGQKGGRLRIEFGDEVWRAAERHFHSGVWTHVAVVFAAEGVQIFVDGNKLNQTQIARAEQSGVDPWSLAAGHGPLFLGANPDLGIGGGSAADHGELRGFLDGALDGVGLWHGDAGDSALDEEFIHDLVFKGAPQLSDHSADDVHRSKKPTVGGSSRQRESMLQNWDFEAVAEELVGKLNADLDGECGVRPDELNEQPIKLRKATEDRAVPAPEIAAPAQPVTEQVAADDTGDTQLGKATVETLATAPSKPESALKARNSARDEDTSLDDTVEDRGAVSDTAAADSEPEPVNTEGGLADSAGVETEPVDDPMAGRDWSDDGLTEGILDKFCPPGAAAEPPLEPSTAAALRRVVDTVDENVAPAVRDEFSGNATADPVADHTPPEAETASAGGASASEGRYSGTDAAPPARDASADLTGARAARTTHPARNVREPDKEPASPERSKVTERAGPNAVRPEPMSLTERLLRAKPDPEWLSEPPKPPVRRVSLFGSRKKPVTATGEHSHRPRYGRKPLRRMSEPDAAAFSYSVTGSFGDRTVDFTAETPTPITPDVTRPARIPPAIENSFRNVAQVSPPRRAAGNLDEILSIQGDELVFR